MFLMYWVDPKDHLLKVLCQYLYYLLRYSRNKEDRPIMIMRPIVIMPTHPNFTHVPTVIHDSLDIVGRPYGLYAESFMLISLLLAEI